MAHFEAWGADCQLGHVERGGKYQCKAAIWADGYDTAIHLLAEYLDRQGYRILWVDECQPTRIYALNSLEIVTGADEGQPVVLGPIMSTDRTVQRESYLTIEEIKDVEPLDEQFGVWPMKTVPDALREPLFGQPEPTEAEITYYNSAGAVPPMNTYAILDAAKVFGLVEILERSGLQYQCLFNGNAAEEYRNVAPYLVELKEDNGLTAILFTHMADQPEEMTTVHLWHKEPGIYVRARATFDDIRSHFRKFTRVQDENGKWFYFRFWESEVLLTYLRVNVSNIGTLGRFAGIAAWSLSFLVTQKSGVRRAIIQRASLGTTGVQPIRFAESDQNAMAVVRWRRFQENLMLHLEHDYPSQYKDLGKGTLVNWSDEGKAKGFRIEMANYNFVAAKILCYGKTQTVDDLIRKILDREKLSELDRSSELLMLAETP